MSSSPVYPGMAATCCGVSSLKSRSAFTTCTSQGPSAAMAASMFAHE
jgi:hypothetical protein